MIRNANSTLAVFAVLLAAGCSGVPTDADLPSDLARSAVINPQISGLSIDRQAVLVRPGPIRIVAQNEPPPVADHEAITGALLLSALPADLQYKIPREAGLTVTVQTSEGDVEQLLMQGPRSCVAVNGRLLARCDRFVVQLKKINDAYHLHSELAKISARFTQIYVTSHTPYATAVVALLTGGSQVEDAMRRARSWPGVVSVEPYRVGHVLGGPPPRPYFEATMAVELGSPVPDDGRVQIRNGSTITVEYRQPDGSILTTTMTVPL